MEKKRNGQRKPAALRKRKSLTFRIRDQLRAQLEKAATAAQRSVSEETEHRLMMSFHADDAFVIDRHPGATGIAFASACSGHGFKHAPLIAEILADLATVGTTDWPIDAFRATRFAS